ncbi:RNA polymerase sigma factor [Chondromyces crocatus]|uniref:ECF family RNA polymerase sigma factor n=1 Tax=Chondromyces crocatus TaxID=52 RepID=A0A0K1E5A7_CHOCO|nr:RNA polymerase sigma factor [Chondromyces crocatus]AKT36034.1 uncharacterized protein CMC5_001460 [Chondromyces crocatus]
MVSRAQRGRLRLVEPSGEFPREGEVTEAALSRLPGEATTEPLKREVALEGARRDTGELEAGVTPGTPTPPPLKSEAPPAGRHGGADTGRAIAELPDAQLVALGQRGDSAALAALYKRHAAFAINLATRIEGSARDVEDIAHDAFLRAFERLSDISDPAAFKSWLGSIVVHKVRSRMRRGRLLNLLGMGRSSEPVDLDALASPDASPHARAQIAQIYALLQTLPADDRIAWILRSVEGHDLDTTARMVGCSLATVKRRITRAQQFLDEHFVDSINPEVV